jgi:hypothetical protein
MSTAPGLGVTHDVDRVGGRSAARARWREAPTRQKKGTLGVIPHEGNANYPNLLVTDFLQRGLL